MLYLVFHVAVSTILSPATIRISLSILLGVPRCRLRVPHRLGLLRRAVIPRMKSLAVRRESEISRARTPVESCVHMSSCAAADSRLRPTLFRGNTSLGTVTWRWDHPGPVRHGTPPSRCIKDKYIIKSPRDYCNIMQSYACTVELYTSGSKRH